MRKKYSIRDLLILTTIVALIVNAGLYAHRLRKPTAAPSPPPMKQQLADMEKINAQLRAELEQVKAEVAAEQATRRAIMPHLRVSRDSV